MKILAIETSCDETAVAILEEKRGSFRILANIISSQVKNHREFGGVVPNLAARLHTKNLPICLDKALKTAKLAMGQVDLFAVTRGPGLIPALLIGVSAAKTLAYVYNKPLIGINHIEGHIYANFLEGGLDFPALFLIVSGGHTQLVLARDHFKYQIIGQTRDDAVGESFDKVARLLDLPYPGGPEIEKVARKHKGYSVVFPSPMLNSPDFDFSFSGLKTAVLYEVQKKKQKDKKYIQSVCYAFQNAAFAVLVKKTLQAAKKYQVKNIAIAGGVAANKILRKNLGAQIKQELPNVKFICPNNKLNTDNAVMIALAAYYRNKHGFFGDWRKVDADANFALTNGVS